MALTLVGWRGPSGDGSGGASLPTGVEGQVVGYGVGGAVVAMNSPDWAALTGKPAAFPPSAHTHTVADVAGLQGDLDGKAGATHAHAWNDITGKPATYPPTVGEFATYAEALAYSTTNPDALVFSEEAAP